MNAPLFSSGLVGSSLLARSGLIAPAASPILAKTAAINTGYAGYAIGDAR